LIEKRKMQRFAIALPSIVWPQNDGSGGAALNLVCRDVSAAGAFFLTSTLLDVGTRVRVVMFLDLDAALPQAAGKAQVSLSGIVTRVEEQGMAVCFEKKYKITPAPQRSPMTYFCREAVR
jgi:hypothetical protein